MGNVFNGAYRFAGVGLETWITSNVQRLDETFLWVVKMNADLSGWNVAKVATLTRTFQGAYKFAGTGLNTWITASVTTLDSTFEGAGEMVADLSGWSVGKVTTLYQAFYGASKFDSDVTSWNVAKVATLHDTFSGASEFKGIGLGSWITTSVTTLFSTFNGAGDMNADLSKWSVEKVTTLYRTFQGAHKFEGTGLASWITAAVSNMEETFDGASVFVGAGLHNWYVCAVTTMDKMFGKSMLTMSSCDKHAIADAWASSTAFAATAYPNIWKVNTCSLTDATFKEASCKLLHPRTPTLPPPNPPTLHPRLL